MVFYLSPYATEPTLMMSLLSLASSTNFDFSRPNFSKTLTFGSTAKNKKVIGSKSFWCLPGLANRSHDQISNLLKAKSHSESPWIFPLRVQQDYLLAIRVLSSIHLGLVTNEVHFLWKE